MIPAWLTPAATGLILLIGTAYDLRWRRVPAWLTLGGIVSGFAAAGLAGGAGLFGSLAGAAVGGLLFAPLVFLGGMGAGDALLLAAVGAWTGAMFVLQVTSWGALFGAVAAVVLWRLGRREFPYVPAISAGAIAAVVAGPSLLR